MLSKRKRGFATLSPAQHLAVSRKGGSKKVPKGFATLTEEERKINAQKAAKAMWDKRRKEKNGKDSIPSRDRSTIT